MSKRSRNYYSIPANQADIRSISSDPKTHVGMDEYAIDYELPENSRVYSVAPGKVIFVKDDSSGGGDDEKYENFTFYNHIVIKHNNGEYSEYGHLKHKSAKVKVGDNVKVGEMIALSGNTGYSSGPHLHFSIFVLHGMSPDLDILPDGKQYFINDEDFGFQTIEPRFID